MELEPALLSSTVTSLAIPVSIAVATTTALSAAVFWFTRPGLTLQFLQNVGFYLLGMRLRQVEVDGINVSYAEKGSRNAASGPSMLFIHGFTASKDMWLSLVPLLPKDQHIVLVDLPGHGDTDMPGENIELHSGGMAKFIHQFVESIQLNREPFHLIGISMGGAVVGKYSAQYPKDVALLTMACPAMLTPKVTDFMSKIKEGDTTSCSLLPQTVEECKAMFKMCLYQKHKAPVNSQLIKAFLEIRRPRNDFYMKLYKLFVSTVEESTAELIQDIHNITCPTQVMWGKHDEIVHVTGVETLKEALPNCQRADIFERCGHIPTFDRPRAMVKALLEFRGELFKRRRIPFL